MYIIKNVNIKKRNMFFATQSLNRIVKNNIDLIVKFLNIWKRLEHPKYFQNNVP